MIDGLAKHGLDRANWAYAELAEQLYQTRGLRVGKLVLQVLARTLAGWHWVALVSLWLPQLASSSA